MREVFLKITDKSGNAFTLDVSTPGAAEKIFEGFSSVPEIGSWKAMDQGFLRYKFGRTRSRLTVNGDMTTRDLLFLSVDEVGITTFDKKDEKFGLQLFEYEDWTGVNSNGEGVVIQPWVLKLTPGRIKWEIRR